jgi:branched-subunit amino acid permease
MRYFLIVIALSLLYILFGCAGMTPDQSVVADSVGVVDQTSEIVNNTGMDFKTLIVFAVLAGWAIPSPSEMFSWIGKCLTFIKWW